jgi:hypothetical protein
VRKRGPRRLGKISGEALSTGKKVLSKRGREKRGSVYPSTGRQG